VAENLLNFHSYICFTSENSLLYELHAHQLTSQ